MSLCQFHSDNKKGKHCWYCDVICYTFVSICNNCIYERINKKHKQKSIKV